jgi:hypothetical protein
MRYQIEVAFDCDEQEYAEYIADSIHAIIGNSLPYMVDNVDIEHYILENENES